MKLKTGDKVIVLSGKDRGKKGTITRVIPEKNRVLVEGVNVVKKHQRAGQQVQGRQVRQGGIIDREMPINASNVAVVSTGDGKPTRIGYRIDDDGIKHRICKRTGSEL
jgi:large subunit ribosomal protein L24